ncbi:unnamed protein product, partial [Agarophyton chilense]
MTAAVPAPAARHVETPPPSVLPFHNKSSSPPSLVAASRPPYLSRVHAAVARRAATRLDAAAAALAARSDALLRAAVVDTSHWGYVVTRAAPLFAAYTRSRVHRMAALHAMQRLLLHVSGASHAPSLDDAQVTRLCRALFVRDARCGDHAGDAMRPLPRGVAAA